MLTRIQVLVRVRQFSPAPPFLADRFVRVDQSGFDGEPENRAHDALAERRRRLLEFRVSPRLDQASSVRETTVTPSK